MVLCKNTVEEVSFKWSPIGFHPQTQKLELHWKGLKLKENLVFPQISTSCLKFSLFSAITWKLQYSYKNRVYWNTKEETKSSGKEKRTAKTWFCVHTQNEKSITRGTLGDSEHRNTAKKITQHRITARKVDETPSPQYIFLSSYL